MDSTLEVNARIKIIKLYHDAKGYDFGEIKEKSPIKSPGFCSPMTRLHDQIHRIKPIIFSLTEISSVIGTQRVA